MKFKEIFTPDVWRMSLTFVIIVGYFILNDFLTIPCQTTIFCKDKYNYNSLNFFGIRCGCISYLGFMNDLILYLIMQFIFPYLLSCLILASKGYLTSNYGKTLVLKKKKKWK